MKENKKRVQKNRNSNQKKHKKILVNNSKQENDMMRYMYQADTSWDKMGDGQEWAVAGRKLSPGCSNIRWRTHGKANVLVENV